MINRAYGPIVLKYLFKPGRPRPVDPLQGPLLLFTKRDAWTVGDSFEGTQIFGAPGSGKTSGSGAAIARAFLSHGYGGLVLTAKPDERMLWERYCRETGRSHQLMIFGDPAHYRLNFLEYQRMLSPPGAITENLTTLLSSVMEVIGHGRGQSNDQFWRQAVRQMLRAALEALRLAGETITLTNLVALISTAPNHPDDLEDARWVERSYCVRCLTAAEGRVSERERHDLGITIGYWLHQVPSMDPRTRSNVIATFTAMIDGMTRGLMRELFCADTNIYPELTHHGVIILIDLPVKTHFEVGQFAQVLWKLLWQRAAERRRDEHRERPVFLWADEAQYFISEHDTQFQNTARAARAATVYLTQDISSYYRQISGPESRSAVDAVLANLNTKVFHANGDPATNEWAERLFAKGVQWRTNTTLSNRPEDSPHRKHGMSSGVSQAMEAEVPAQRFTMLRTGGPHNHGRVEAMIFKSGRTWTATGKNHLKVTFLQQ